MRQLVVQPVHGLGRALGNTARNEQDGGVTRARRLPQVGGHEQTFHRRQHPRSDARIDGGRGLGGKAAEQPYCQRKTPSRQP